ncbi:MAG: hypothetical protein ACM3S0_04540 [Acidobacteriota bacterium]
MSEKVKPNLRWAWIGALGVFVLAGSTGALYRFGMLMGLPFGLVFTNVRHAHSHLMYFGWVTPALMAFIATRLPDVLGWPLKRSFNRVILVTFIFALIAYVPFLLYGYGIAEIAGRPIPPGVIGASLNILAWYAYVWIYSVNTRGASRNRALRFWDWALLFQLLASLGAWGRGVLVALKVTDPFVTTAMVDLFLDLFSDGWFVLALLGLAFAAYPAADSTTARRAQWLIIIGMPVTFLLGVSVDLVPTPLRLIGGAGGILVALGLLLTIAALWRAVGGGWRIALAFLAIKAFAELGLSVPPLAAWGEAAGLRILYLHTLLLGFVSLGLLAAARDAWGQVAVRGRAWMTVSVLVLIATLVPLTNLMPREWGGRWALEIAAIAALLPPLAAVLIMWQAGHFRDDVLGESPTSEYAT